MAWIYLMTFSVVFALAWFGLSVRLQWNKLNTSKRNCYDLYDVSVVIPFRNEADSLPALLVSLQQLTRFPREIIWIDDHSEDGSLALIQQFALPCEQQVIQLIPGDEGKKTALRVGIAAAKGDYILTWDADIRVPARYFEALSHTSRVPLLVLPVWMKAHTLPTSFFELDYHYFNTINAAISGHRPPISASGANLLFHKETFFAHDSIEEHEDMASGDDLFLLSDFKRAGEEIELSMHRELLVQTDAPPTWEAFFNQRLRWIGKTSAVQDRFAQGIGIIGLTYHVGFWLLLVSDSSWWMFGLCAAAKMSFDTLLVQRYYQALGGRKTWLLMPAFSWLYPIYTMMILVMTLFYNPVWKGREI